jgi:hypothetical protein
MAYASKSLGIALLACFVAGCAGPATAKPVAWDQAAVTKLAQQLVEAATAWQAAVLRQPEAGIRLNNNAQAMFDQSTTLAAHLAKGEDRGKTLDYYRGLKEVTDDTAELNDMAPFEQVSQTAWTKVAGLMAQLASYYGT